MKHSAHLILKRKYYDMIKNGEKVVEYRDNTPYWRQRLWGKKLVVFHRGYTNETMMFQIHKGIIPDDLEKQIEIHLGARVR